MSTDTRRLERSQPMWWEILPWLAFLVCLGATVGVYQHRHRRQERRLGEAPATTERDDRIRRLTR
jgi:hypothetical protein